MKKTWLVPLLLVGMLAGCANGEGTEGGNTEGGGTTPGTGAKIEITSAALDLAGSYNKETIEATVDGLKIAYFGVMGGGESTIQTRNNNEKTPPQSFMWNVDATATDIKSVTFTYNEVKLGDNNPEAQSIVFGSTTQAEAAAGEAAWTAVKGTLEYTVTAPAGAKFFKFTHISAHTMYLDSITLNF